MARRSGLGKGLGALIPSEVAAAEHDATLRELPVSQIERNPHQPRDHFDEEALVALTASVTELGVLQPVLVRPVGADRYELIAGERRWRAAKRAGLQTIPAVVRRIGDTASLEQAVVENLHRQDLNALEEAAAYQQLIEEFHLSHDEVARRVGKSRSAVTNTLRLLQLPAGIQKLVTDGQLAAGHARALLGTPDRAFPRIALFLRSVLRKLAAISAESEIESGLLYTKEIHFLEAFCKTLEESYELGLSGGVLEVKQSDIDNIIAIYDRKHSSPEIKSLLKLLIHLLHVRAPLALSESLAVSVICSGS